VIARYDAGCPSGGDGAAAGRLVPAAPAECPGGVLPPDERAVGDAEGDHGPCASACPLDRRDADARHGRRAPASSGRCTTRPRPDGPAREAPGQGVRLWVGPNTRRHSDVTLTPEAQFLGRPPVVKSQKSPVSGCVFLSPPLDVGIVGTRQRVLTRFPHAGVPMWRHHTRLEGLSPCARRVQSVARTFSATSKRLGARVPSDANDGITVTRCPVRCRRG